MIIFCNVMKNYIFQACNFRVFWSKRGYFTASSKAGSMPGAGRGYMESNGESPCEAVANLETALIARREELQQKINEIRAALQEIREDGYQAQDLELLAERKTPEL
jgi:hypothetical protein